MKKIINYEKDILFKTSIGSILSISLEHDFTVDDDALKGEFILTGEYKANELSINKESFIYHLPLEYELPKEVDKETLEYDIDNFEYNIRDDCLSIMIDFYIRYEEKSPIPKLPEIETIEEELVSLPKLNEPIENRIQAEDKEVILNTTLEDDYIEYHVHITKEGETLEEIANKYHTSIDTIKKYNTIDYLENKTKIIIPKIDE